MVEKVEKVQIFRLIYLCSFILSIFYFKYSQNSRFLEVKFEFFVFKLLEMREEDEENERRAQSTSDLSNPKGILCNNFQNVLNKYVGLS